MILRTDDFFQNVVQDVLDSFYCNKFHFRETSFYIVLLHHPCNTFTPLTTIYRKIECVADIYK